MLGRLDVGKALDQGYSRLYSLLQQSGDNSPWYTHSELTGEGDSASEAKSLRLLLPPAEHVQSRDLKHTLDDYIICAQASRLGQPVTVTYCSQLPTSFLDSPQGRFVVSYHPRKLQVRSQLPNIYIYCNMSLDGYRMVIAFCTTRNHLRPQPFPDPCATRFASLQNGATTDRGTAGSGPDSRRGIRSGLHRSTLPASGLQYSSFNSNEHGRALDISLHSLPFVSPPQ
jgi:hypothetical protein